MRALLVAGWIVASGAGAVGFDHSHAAWTALLERYVRDEGVRYAAWREDRGGLDAYLRSLGEVSREEFDGFSREQRLAFWINAYNALTVRVILDHYPIRGRLLSLAPANSIRQIPGVWDRFPLELVRGKTSLNAIEHEILRREFGEPRIHVAINCASVGCPPLRPEAYRADRIEAQLEDQSRRFALDPIHVRLDREGRELRVSRIFDWFGEDFSGRYEWEGPEPEAGSGAAVLGFLHPHLSPEDRRFLETTPVRIRYLDYDWSLNEWTED